MTFKIGTILSSWPELVVRNFVLAHLFSSSSLRRIETIGFQSLVWAGALASGAMSPNKSLTDPLFLCHVLFCVSTSEVSLSAADYPVGAVGCKRLTPALCGGSRTAHQGSCISCHLCDPNWASWPIPWRTVTDYARAVLGGTVALPLGSASMFWGTSSLPLCPKQTAY